MRPAADLPFIAGFRVEREIGRGGMGVVYEAEQHRPRRKVALKLLRSGALSAELRRRFEYEAHLLGRLQHPGIARVYEARTAPSPAGEIPYFAMELVRGRPLLEHAAAEGLGLRARLELLALISDAVQHAHAKGVIHRDLKPSNVLVKEAGRPVVLDFGVARATDADVEVTTLHTGVGELLGTLPYMSPEQTAGDSYDLDTRSDVYALGVVGYELLAGRLPYDVGSTSLPEALRVIQEEPPRPLSPLEPACRGDVETILGRALEKERGRRYQTAGDFAADLRRFLVDEPIAARPASRTYHFFKFARRNRVLVGAAAAATAILVLGTAVSANFAAQSSLALARTTSANRLATERLARVRETRDELQAAVAAAIEAQAEAERQGAIAVAVRAFLEDDVIGPADPTVHFGRDRTIAEALEAASARMDGKFADQPEVELSLRLLLYSIHQRLRRPDLAGVHLARALALAETLHGADSDRVRDLRRFEAVLDIDRSLYDSARELLEPMLARDEAAFAEGHPQRLRTTQWLGAAYYQLNRTEEARELFERAVRGARDSGSIPEGELRGWEKALGDAHISLGRLDEAEEIQLALLEAQRADLGDDHPATLSALDSLAVLYMEKAEYARAEELALEAVEGAERTFGTNNAVQLRYMTTLAGILSRQGRFEESLALQEAKLDAQRQSVGPAHAETLETQFTMIGSLLQLGHAAQAEELGVETLRLQIETLGEANIDVALTLGALATVYKSQGRLERAAELFERQIAVATEVGGRDHATALVGTHNLAGVHEELGRTDEAIEAFRAVATGYARTLGPKHPNALIPLASLARLHVSLYQGAEAEPLLVDVLPDLREALGERHWIVGNFLEVYGVCLRQLGRADEAHAALSEALSILTQVFGPESSRVLNTRRLLDQLEAEREAD